MIRQIDYKATYSIRQQVLWPNKPLDFIALENDCEGVHFGVYVEDLLVSVISVFEEDHGIQFRKFATLQSHQGKGYGTVLLQHVFDYAKDRGVERIWCNARQTKTHFYKRFGMEEKEAALSKEGVAYVIMEKKI